jgi:hypothetical protein
MPIEKKVSPISSLQSPPVEVHQHYRHYRPALGCELHYQVFALAASEVVSGFSVRSLRTSAGNSRLILVPRIANLSDEISGAEGGT